MSMNVLTSIAIQTCVCVCVCMRVYSVHGCSASIQGRMWLVLWVVWGQQMYGSTVPEASKLPVIFPMMQRSLHNHRESVPLCCLQRASPTHRLTGCHNNPDPTPCLLEQNSWKPTTTKTPLVTTPSRRIHWIPDKHPSLC